MENKLGKYADKNIDTIILGCTHFGIYEKELKNIFPTATLVPCGLPTANELKRVLEEKDAFVRDVERMNYILSVNDAACFDYLDDKYQTYSLLKKYYIHKFQQA